MFVILSHNLSKQSQLVNSRLSVDTLIKGYLYIKQKLSILIGSPPVFCHVIGARSRGCPITADQFQLFVIGYL